MITVEYSPLAGIAVPDGECDLYAKGIMRKGHWFFSTENVFMAIRLRVKRGEISTEHIRFRFQDEDLKINRDGTLNHWPKGFLDLNDRQLSELLDMR